MPRYAVVENGRVVGVLGCSTPPTFNVPVGRSYVDITEIPEIQGGELWDGNIFSSPATPDITTRLAKVEQAVAVLQAKAPTP